MPIVSDGRALARIDFGTVMNNSSNATEHRNDAVNVDHSPSLGLKLF
jgi:hypothetical protein